jgi:hypothetical protein
MPASPWRTFGSSAPEQDYVALLSYLPLKSYWRIPVFFFYTAQVVNQLASAAGVLGYSVLAHPLSKRFWTLSAWKDEAALRTFVQYPPQLGRGTTRLRSAEPSPSLAPGRCRPNSVTLARSQCL